MLMGTVSSRGIIAQRYNATSISICHTIIRMSARRSTFWHKRMAVWQTFICLTVVAFLCRAIIPVGYMPDSSPRGDTFAITLCSMGGVNSVMLVDFSDPDDKAAPDDNQGNYECPFGLNVAQTLLPGHDAAFVQVVFNVHPLTVAESRQGLPALPALGPPLGSRAPPSNLG